MKNRLPGMMGNRFCGGKIIACMEPGEKKLLQILYNCVMLYLKHILLYFTLRRSPFCESLFSENLCFSFTKLLERQEVSGKEDVSCRTGGSLKIASLKYDDVFREVFAREGVRRQLISDVTGIPLEVIASARLTTPFLRKRFRREKQGILDIAVILTDGTRVDIELQLRPQKYWLKRNLFYLAKMYTGDLRAGQRYDCLNRCIAISILDFNLVPGEECHTAYTLRDKRGQELTDLFEVHIIELKKQICPGDAVGDWIRLINAENTEELEMIVTGNAGILEAMEVMRTMSLGKRLRMRYEAHLKAVRDRWAEDEYVRDQGIEEGLVRGKAEGKADTVLLLLSEKGTVSGELEEMIRRERDPERLDSLVKAAARAESVEAFRKTSVL